MKSMLCRLVEKILVREHSIQIFNVDELVELQLVRISCKPEINLLDISKSDDFINLGFPLLLSYISA